MLKYILLFLLALYRFCISPFLGNNCRFYPTCSEYSRIVIQRYGPFKGTYLTVLRLLKCHPWHPGGTDHPA
ncbi:membrane protein insertion efficiency factor YidD [Acetobacteraceae bacterium]|nr:membrane protein insertion efficiency factor YidD [Acetobacteraceae bacterium]